MGLLALRTPAQQSQLEPIWPVAIERAAAEAGIPLSAISVVVKGSRGETLLALNEGLPRKTGSVMKLLTTFVALQQLGPQFRFHTDFLADPKPRHPGQWSVALRGGGDSGFQYSDLLELLKQAQSQGVHAVKESIVVDRRRFMQENQLNSGIDVAPDSLSGIAPDALSIGYSAVEVRLPENHQGRIEVDPPFQVVSSSSLNRLKRTPCQKDWDEGLHLIPQEGQQEKLNLIGNWPSHCPEAVLHRAPLSPRKQLAWSMRLAMKQLGLSNQSEVSEGPAPSYAKVSIRYPSRPLERMVRDINKYSNNVAARTLLMNLAAENGVLPARAEDGAQVIQKWLKSRNLEFPELVIENGSGLSHKEVMSAGHLAGFLMTISKEEIFSSFLDSLPIPGEMGTLQKRFLVRADRLQWHLKTGRLDGVRTLAGFHVGVNGELTTVVCMVEHTNTDRVQILQEAILNWVQLKEIDTNTSPQRQTYLP